MDRNKRILSLLVTLAITLACVPALPAVAPLPTQPVGAVDTMIAGTYAAASTGTAINTTPTPTLSDTLTPSRTPTITPTGTATIIFKTPTLFSVGGGGGSSGGGSSSGGSSGGGGSTTPTYACKLVKTIPAYGAHLPRNKNFNTTWRVANTGDIVWDHNSVDYLYLSGTPMHKQSLYDIPISVGPKRQVDLTVRMQVPSKKGTYVTTWTMKVGSDTFCTLEQMIVAE
jgi:hypothetical protein